MNGIANPRSPIMFIGVVVLLASACSVSPQSIQAQVCDPQRIEEILEFADAEDDEFYYGIGDATSSLRRMARNMATADARGNLAIQAQADIVASSELTDTNTPDILTDFHNRTETVAEATVVAGRVLESDICREDNGDWSFMTIIRTEKANVILPILRKVESNMLGAVEAGATPYSEAEVENYFAEIRAELNRQGSGATI